MEVKSRIILCLLMTITLECNRTEGRNPLLHRVGGGRFTWAPNVNFTEWTTHQHFYKGDWLYFGFDKHIYNVLEVNQEDYENCVDTNFINNITRGGRDVFQLLETRTYYFLSGRGFCFQGMKVAINVEKPLPLPLPPPLPNKAFTSRRMSHMKLFVLFFTVLLWWTFIQAIAIILDLSY